MGTVRVALQEMGMSVSERELANFNLIQYLHNVFKVLLMMYVFSYTLLWNLG